MIRLIPIAKPVRYTIKSGGRDCADLNDLLKSFNVDDLLKIDIKQLHEWAKRRCANVPSIAEKLSKQPSELEYYQIFYQHDFKDLHAAWKWLKASGEYEESANTLYHTLINRGDKETISDILKGKSAEDITHLISSGDIDVNSNIIKTALRNSPDVCKQIISLFGKKGELSVNDRNILSFLEGIGFNDAKDIIAAQDKKDFEKQFKGISDEELISKLTQTSDKDFDDHKEFFAQMAKDIISLEPKYENNNFKILENLASREIKEAKDYVDKNSCFSKDEFSKYLLYILDYKGNDIEFDAKMQFGKKVENLHDNLKDFAKAVYYCNSRLTSYNGDNCYNLALKTLKKDKRHHISDQRLFFCLLLEEKLGGRSYNAINTLWNNNYYFVLPFKNKITLYDWKKVPKAFDDFCHDEWTFNPSVSMDNKTFKDLLRIYFTYFLKPEYFNGKLEDL